MGTWPLRDFILNGAGGHRAVDAGDAVGFRGEFVRDFDQFDVGRGRATAARPQLLVGEDVGTWWLESGGTPLWVEREGTALLWVEAIPSGL